MNKVVLENYRQELLHILFRLGAIQKGVERELGASPASDAIEGHVTLAKEALEQAKGWLAQVIESEG